MEFELGRCPKCKELINVTKEVRTCFCEKCGSHINIFDVKFLDDSSSKTMDDKSKLIISYLKSAQEYIDVNDYSSAEQYYNMVLNMDKDNTEAKEKLAVIKRLTRGNLHIKCSDSQNRNKTIEIYIDNKQLSNIYYGESNNFVVPFGTHNIVLKSGMLSTEMITISINSRDDDFTLKYYSDLFKIGYELSKESCEHYEKLSSSQIINNDKNDYGNSLVNQNKKSGVFFEVKKIIDSIN